MRSIRAMALFQPTVSHFRSLLSLFPLTTFHCHDSTLLFQTIMEFLKTLFLFTKSDIKTILIPVTVFAVATAPLEDSVILPQLMFWIWLHVLQCALANQCLGPEEDALNKPDRPIPAGRITVSNARILRWLSVPACLALSACYSKTVFQASISLTCFLIIYNELEMNSHWLSRNILNGLGLACFEVGATLIAGRDWSKIDPTSVIAITVSCCIFLTTIHTQDFKDVVGDMTVGRRTLPMIFPFASRVFVLLALVAWSAGLAYLWQIGPVLIGTLLTLAILVGGRFVLFDSISDDQKSFYLYNVWLTLANALPALTYRAL